MGPGSLQKYNCLGMTGGSVMRNESAIVNDFLHATSKLIWPHFGCSCVLLFVLDKGGIICHIWMQFMMHISSSPPSQFSDDHYAATSVRWGIQNWFMKHFRKNINCLLYAAMIFTFVFPFLIEPFNGNEKINQQNNETTNSRDVKMKKRRNDKMAKWKNGEITKRRSDETMKRQNEKTAKRRNY